MRIEPAALTLDARGTPYSPEYADVYHSADSGPGQARHVFIAGNDLPRRWWGRRTFTILETGFGLGINFLTTWQAWLDDPARCERLHFVSIDKHPLDVDALERVHARYGELVSLSRQLRAAWPLLVPGLHRLHFEGERVTLTLALGDVAHLLPRLRLTADAIYLDGFAPDRNADMWSPRLLRRLSRVSYPGTTLATWSTAGGVRHALEAAGFALETRPGFGRKREMLAGRFAPRRPVAHAAENSPVASKHAIVVGAGLAGAAVTERLASRGWRVELIDRKPAFMVDSADRFAGVFHPHVSPDDCIRSRVARGGFLYALARWRALERAGYALAWARCGVLQIARDAHEETRMVRTIAALGYPVEYAEYVDRERAERLSGSCLSRGGWWFPDGGWMRPSSLVAAQLAAAGAALSTRFATTVRALRRGEKGWEVLAADGSVIATAPVVILANAAEAMRLAPVAATPEVVRGQVTYLSARELDSPRVVVVGAGYVLPAVDGLVVTGSTYDPGDDDAGVRMAGHERNLARLAQLLPSALDCVDTRQVDGATAFRCVVRDRLPVVGEAPDIELAGNTEAGARLGDIPRRDGLYCVSALASRGLIWSALAGEIVASLIEGEPLPLESDLADALDPARFVLRHARRGKP